MQYTEGSVFDGRYLLKEFKGSGSFGEVWLALDQQTEVEVAVKIYVAMDSHGLSEFKKEFQVSFNLNHTNLLHANFLEVCKEDQRAYLVMPYCPQGSTSKMMGKMTEEQLWEFISDVSSGLAYLHGQNPPIIHQDIKPDNILVARNGEYVITDFGISSQARSTLRKSSMHLSSAGAVAYMGPERFSKQYFAVKASDIWSLGVTIYELAVGDLPFCGMGGSMQKQGADIPDLPEEFSNELNMVMQSCLAKETWDRPTAEQLADYANQKKKGHSPQPTWALPEEYGEKATDMAKPTLQATVPLSKSTPSKAMVKSTNKGVETKQTEASAGTSLGNGVSKKQSASWISWVVIIVTGLAVGAALSFLS